LGVVYGAGGKRSFLGWYSCSKNILFEDSRIPESNPKVEEERDFDLAWG
jgi:hypothetical protein